MTGAFAQFACDVKHFRHTEREEFSNICYFEEAFSLTNDAEVYRPNLHTVLDQFAEPECRDFEKSRMPADQREELDL
jgi:hypothetical protein